MKKMIALILALCMTCSLLTAYAEETQAPAATDAPAEETAAETLPEAEAKPKAEESLDDLLGKLFGGEEDSAESSVLGFLSGLGIDTDGYKEKIAQTVDQVKNAAGVWFGSVKQQAGNWLSQLGAGMDSLLGELNVGLEQVNSTAASQVEELRTLLEEMVKAAAEEDPESELTKALNELLETAKGIAEDDDEAVTEIYNKLMEIIMVYCQ